MAKSIKLKNNIYIDSTSIVHNKNLLNEILEENIIEGKGDNTNGSYIKYKNGILICFGNKAGTSNIQDYWNYKKVSSSITFANSFISAPSISVSCGATAYLSINVYNKTKTGFSFDVIKASNNNDYNMSYFAIGQWK